MKKDKLIEALSGIKEEYIDEAAPKGVVKKSSFAAKAAVVAACLCLFAVSGFLISYGMKAPEPTPPVHTGDAVTHTDPAETTSPAETSGTVEDSTDTGESDVGIGGTALCKVHDELYHLVPDFLAELRDEKEMYDWANTLKIDESKANSETECPYEYNIKLLIDKFGITKEEFVEAYPVTTCGLLDIDLLYNGTSEEIDKYYRNLELFSIESIRAGHYSDVFAEIFMAYYDEIYEMSENKDVIETIPVPKLVVMFDIDHDELIKYIDTATQKSMETYGECYTFDYDLDMLYGADGEIILEIDADMSDKDIDEMFCRVGRYADNDVDFIGNSNDTAENKPVIGGSGHCYIHHEIYHQIPGWLAVFVGEDENHKWCQDLWDSIPDSNYNDLESCPAEEFNIKAYIDHFGITREDFESVHYSLQYCEVDLDVLFDGTAAEVEQYFRNIDELNIYGYKRSHYGYVVDLIRDAYADELDKLETDYYHSCIPELVVMFDIERSELESYIRGATEKVIKAYDGKKYAFDYNIDMLYDSDGRVKLELNDSVRNNRKLRNQLDEMFCRIGRCADNDLNLIDNPDAGVKYNCTVHHTSYHMTPAWLIEYIGIEEYREWKNSLTSDGLNTTVGECGLISNIKKVIDHFDIPVEVFTENCTYPLNSEYNLNLLYNATEDEIDKYYRNEENFKYALDCHAHHATVMITMWFEYMNELRELMDPYRSIYTFSIPEAVYGLNITRDELEEIFKKAADDCISVHGVCYTYEYNLEMIYGEDGESFEPLEKLLAVNEDDDPTNDISSNELREMFCRVGRYAE